MLTCDSLGYPVLVNIGAGIVDILIRVDTQSGWFHLFLGQVDADRYDQLLLVRVVIVDEEQSLVVKVWTKLIISKDIKGLLLTKCRGWKETIIPSNTIQKISCIHTSHWVSVEYLFTYWSVLVVCNSTLILVYIDTKVTYSSLVKEMRLVLRCLIFDLFYSLLPYQVIKLDYGSI